MPLIIGITLTPRSSRRLRAAPGTGPVYLKNLEFDPMHNEALATRNGLLPQDFGLLDTVLVWPGESVRIALDFSHPFSGDPTYMFHCHNLEHEDSGMMIAYKVKA